MCVRLVIGGTTVVLLWLLSQWSSLCWFCTEKGEPTCSIACIASSEGIPQLEPEVLEKSKQQLGHIVHIL